MLVYRSFFIAALLLLAHCSPQPVDTKAMAHRLRAACSPPRSDLALLHNVQKHSPPPQLPHDTTGSFFDSLKRKKESLSTFLATPVPKTGLLKINLHSFTVLELFRA